MLQLPETPLPPTEAAKLEHHLIRGADGPHRLGSIAL